MITVGESTPYNAVLGRQPLMLPPLLDADAADTKGDSADGRREARIREIAVNSMVQATSIARISRTLNSKTVGDTQIEYRAGDLVDYRKQPHTKDKSPCLAPYQWCETHPLMVKL